MGNPITEAGLFLTQTLFDFYIYIVMLRVILQWVGADFYNPLSRFIARLTDKPLKPLRKVIPAFRGIDQAAIAFLLILKFIEISLIIIIKTHGFPDFIGLLVWSFAQLLNQLINIFFGAILAVTFLNWVNPGVHTSLTVILYQITEPILKLARRFIGPVGGFDLSPIIILIGLQLITIMVVHPLVQIGVDLTLNKFLLR